METNTKKFLKFLKALRTLKEKIVRTKTVFDRLYVTSIKITKFEYEKHVLNVEILIQKKTSDDIFTTFNFLKKLIDESISSIVPVIGLNTTRGIRFFTGNFYEILFLQINLVQNTKNIKGIELLN